MYVTAAFLAPRRLRVWGPGGETGEGPEPESGDGRACTTISKEYCSRM